MNIQIFDIKKCFDALWAQECINDIFEAGVQNEKLPLLYMENNGKCAMKINDGKSERIELNNIIMQGTVWRSLYCATTMDKLAKTMYMDDELMHKYKGVVNTPCLGMVDDLLIVQKCSTKALKANAVANAFVEMKKLKFNKDKCYRIHIGKPSRKYQPCPELKVHEDALKTCCKEKYLGDIIDQNGASKATIESRKSKGYAAVSEIMAILKDIPLGEHKMEIGLHLRQAVLLNV